MGRLLALLAIAACHHASAQTIDAMPDAADAALPDLTLVAAEMDGTTVVTDDTFTSDACEVVEGCITEPGTRRLLRFATVVENLGPGDLLLGTVPPPGVSNATFVWSECHMHHHVPGFASYEIDDATGTVMTGHKQGFCLEDSEQVSPEGPSHGYNCNYQGISPGWADVYGNGLPCQWIDITDVPSGTYTLRVVVDPTDMFPDSNPNNNEWATQVTF